MSWHLGRLAAFDLETTSAEPEQALIVEAFVGYVGGGKDPVEARVLAAVEVPDEAAKIHGYTTDYLAEHGEAPKVTVHATAELVAGTILDRVPLVGHNVRYDLTVLDRECRRHGLPTVEERTGGVVGPVIDTLILSKYLDPWRRRVSAEQGAHCLKTCAQTFKVAWADEDAHGARYDALVSARVAWWMGTIAHMPSPKRPRIQAGRGDDRHLFNALAVDLPTLHAQQKQWAAEQAASFQEWLRSAKAGEKRDVNAVISGAWPLVPALAQAQEAAK